MPNLESRTLIDHCNFYSLQTPDCSVAIFLLGNKFQFQRLIGIFLKLRNQVRHSLMAFFDKCFEHHVCDMSESVHDTLPGLGLRPQPDTPAVTRIVPSYSQVIIRHI